MQTRKKKKKIRIFSAVECEVSTNPTESRNPRNGWKISADLYLQRFFSSEKDLQMDTEEMGIL